MQCFNALLVYQVLALVDESGTSSVRAGVYQLRVGGDALAGGCDDDNNIRVEERLRTCARIKLTLTGNEQVLFSMAELERRHVQRTRDAWDAH